MSVVLITGAATGIGNLTAQALARAGHTVYASMRDPRGRNAGRADALLALGSREHLDLRTVELDVQSQDSADAAVATVTGAAGRLDVVVQNAGHLYAGYIEAFTPQEMARLLDVNVLGAQRVSRAALPHMREQGCGTLVWVGSTTTVTIPPFLGPYVVSKAAMDSLAVATAYEVAPFGMNHVTSQGRGAGGGPSLPTSLRNPPTWPIPTEPSAVLRHLFIGAVGGCRERWGRAAGRA